VIKINTDKARTIAHELRRAARSAEFAPLDEQIARRLPGADLDALEAARQAVRDRYAVIQTTIDLAGSADGVKAALEAFGLQPLEPSA
jgi:hypothetical protein